LAAERARRLGDGAAEDGPRPFLADLGFESLVDGLQDFGFDPPPPQDRDVVPAHEPPR